MTVDLERFPDCLVTLRVSADPEETAAWRLKLVDGYVNSSTLPGYRSGKAPRILVEHRYKKEIEAGLRTILLGEAMRQVSSGQSLRLLEIVNEEDFANRDDRISFTVTAVERPAFELPQYKGLPVKPRLDSVTESEIDAAIAELREQAADFVDVDGRPVQMDDYVVVDYHGTIDGAAVVDVFPAAGWGVSANTDFWLRMTPEVFFPGYAQNLVGTLVGETRTFELIVPDDFPVTGMPGTTIRYVVTVKSIKEQILPPLDDAFADSISMGRSLPQLHESLRDELAKRKKAEAKAKLRSRIVQHLLEGVSCELPRALVRLETQRILTGLAQERQARGATSDSREEVREVTAVAQKRVKLAFVLQRIAEAEALRVRSGEVSRRIVAWAGSASENFDLLWRRMETSGEIREVEGLLLNEKVLVFLEEQAVEESAPIDTP